ncbi:MAG: S8 family peptidase [Anaerovoracaceae bacterium]|jgi:subtilisin family serine protease
MKKAKKWTIVFLSIAVCFSMSAPSFAVSETGETTSAGSTAVAQPANSEADYRSMLKGKKYEEDSLIVTFKEGVGKTAAENVAETQDASIEDTTRVDGSLMARVSISDDDTMKQAMKNFDRSGKVEQVQPNYEYKVKGSSTDPAISKQYQFTRMNIDDAWTEVENDSDSNRGKSATTVAVIDTGCDVDHSDLQDNLSVSTNSKGTRSYVSAVDNSLGGTGVSRDDSDQDEGHGTHVCGIIGADYGNGKGGSGIASGHNNDLVKVIPIQASADGSSFYTYDLVTALKIAGEKDADVVNLSLGASVRDRVLEGAIKDLYDKEIVIVNASGNDGSDDVCTPGCMPEVISVNATDQYGEVPYYSNYGYSNDVSAPGDNIYSTVVGDGYATLSGTSMASPCVAGVVALMLDVNSDLTPKQIRNILCATTKQQQAGEGFDESTYAYGEVDAEAAVKAAKNASSSYVQSLEVKMSQDTVNVGDNAGVEALVKPATSLADVTYTSSNTSVATVDEDGNVTGVAPGEATITAHAGYRTASCTVTVTKSVPAKSLKITKKVKEVGVKDTSDMIDFDLQPENVTNTEIYYRVVKPGTDIDVFMKKVQKSGGTLSVTDDVKSDVAWVDELGQIHGKKTGKATVIVSNYNGKVYDSYTFTVLPLVSKIKIHGTTKAVAGHKKTYTAKLLSSSGSTNVAHKKVTWSVNDKTRATISSSGVLKAKRAGTVYVTAKVLRLRDASGKKHYRTDVKKVRIYSSRYSGKSSYRLTASASGSKARLKWKKVGAAKKYTVYRATKKSGKYRKVRTTSSRSLRVSRSRIHTYYYKVRVTSSSVSGIRYGYSNIVKVSKR